MIASITSASNQYIALQRLTCLQNPEIVIRLMLGTEKGKHRSSSSSGNDGLSSETDLSGVKGDCDRYWTQSRKIGVYVWLLPPLMLRITVYLFIAGLLALLWTKHGTSGTASDTKVTQVLHPLHPRTHTYAKQIATMSSSFFLIAFGSHAFNLWWLSIHLNPTTRSETWSHKTTRYLRCLVNLRHRGSIPRDIEA